MESSPFTRCFTLAAIVGIVISLEASTGASAAGPADPATACADLLQAGESRLNKGDIATADRCFHQALIEAEKLNKTDKRVALVLSDLALTSAINPDKAITKKAKLDKAIAYQKRAVEIDEMAYGADAENVAFDLQNLGAWYGMDDMPKEGEAALRRAVAIREKFSAANNPRLAMSLGSLAEMLKKQKRDIEALACYKRAATIYKAADRPAEQSRVLNAEATLLEDQDNYKEAQSIIVEVVQLRERATGKDTLLVAESLHNLAVCDMKLGNNKEALPLLKRALVIVQKSQDKEITATVQATLKKCESSLKSGFKPEAK
jgi:tetratricopeptide (TPR) repeat protein